MPGGGAVQEAEEADRREFEQRVAVPRGQEDGTGVSIKSSGVREGACP